MPVKDEVWVIDDESILTVEDGKAGRPRKAGGRTARRPSPVGEPAVQVAVRRSTTGSRKPILAAISSLFVCGAGQVLNGQRQLGALFFLIEATVITFHWSATAMWGFLTEMGVLFEVAEETMILTVAGMDLFLAGFILFNVAQAYHFAAATEGEAEPAGHPVLPGLASLVVPGMGQLINAQLGKALAFLFLVLAGGLAASSPRLLPFGEYFHRINLAGRLGEHSTQLLAAAVFAAAAVWAFSVYDAFIVARYRSR